MGLGQSEAKNAAIYTQKAQLGELDMAVGLLNQNMFQDELSSKLDLHISLSGVTHGVRSAIFLFLFNSKTNKWDLKGQTEESADQIDINFIQCLSIKYLFEERQKIRFELVSNKTPLCTLETHVHVLVNAHKQTLSEQMIITSNCGGRIQSPPTLTIFSDQENEKGSSNMVHINLSGRSFNGARILFFTILRSKTADSSEMIPVYQSEGTKNVGGVYKWNSVHMLSSIMLKNDPNRLMQIQLHKWRPNGKHKLLGTTEGSFGQMCMDKPKWVIKNYGEIRIERMEIEEKHSFLDYIFGGCNIALLTAIDYTASNGKPNLPSSLHYFDPKTNQYLKAISTVGGILEFYDSDKMIPVLGFGGVYPGIPKACHCFALNGNILNPEIAGIQKIQEIYQQSLMKIQLSGPTNFASIIKYAADMASAHVNNGMKMNYFILLILTDGLIMDMEQTITEIVKASDLPLSIIIVGVGSEDFTEMEILDADDVPLFSKSLNKYMSRDIVQFVPFSEFKDNPEDLAREVLNEVPRQLTEYMSKNNIIPQPHNIYSPPEDFNYFGRLEEFVRTELMANGYNGELVEEGFRKGIPCTCHHHMQITLQPGAFNHLAQGAEQMNPPPLNPVEMGMGPGMMGNIPVQHMGTVYGAPPPRPPAIRHMGTMPAHPAYPPQHGYGYPRPSPY